eukprot:TRINITY_DN5525_c0_g1_i1.p1 TRINITY_DN5525_c0_g1~~TRINITY_DN5525_c0_g1_i1.p1  ORF type:complete len:392 (-),score=137.79 TRINITY_DN5525_c0_g1_i1:118-1293(-)
MDVDAPGSDNKSEENQSSDGENAEHEASEEEEDSDDQINSLRSGMGQQRGSHHSNQANKPNKPNKPQPPAPDTRLRPIIPGLPVSFIIDPCDRTGSELKSYSRGASHPVTFSNDGRPLNLTENILICFGIDNNRDEDEERDSNEELDYRVFEKRTKDPSIDASNEVPEGDKMTLANCFELFMQKETLGADNPWYCNKCKEHKQASKKFDLWELPRILVVHLKRFSFEESSNRREKIETYIDFDIDELDLTKYIQSEAQRKAGHGKYVLYAVSNHYGGLGGGHYTAYGFNHRENGWYKYDDSSVSSVNKESVKTSAAYVLFYRRKEENEEEWRALSGEEAEQKKAGGRRTEGEGDREEGENEAEANITETDSNEDEEERNGGNNSNSRQGDD